MVDKPSQVASLGSVNDGIGVNPEQVAASDTQLLVARLALVGQALPDGLADILDDHLVCRDRLHGVQTPAVNSTLKELQFLLTELKRENGRIILLSSFAD